jgi:5-methylthioadenosine/S-adenosylhomocysteine deaminase
MRASISDTPLDSPSGDVPKRHVIPGHMERFYRDWHGAADGRIQVDVCIHSLYLLSNDEVEASVDVARRLGRRIHIHLLETEWERDEIKSRYGMGAIDLAEKLGVFDVPVMAAHCVVLDDRDIEKLKGKDVHISNNPTSNLKLGSGIARLPEILAAGIPVALGTDGVASNNNLDMFEEMNLTAILHKGVSRDPMAVCSWQAICMGTSCGARLMGLEKDVGRVEAGMKADLILLAIDQPHFTPLVDANAAVLYAAHGSDVDTVMVDGRILMEGRRLVTVDEEKAAAMVRAASERIIGQVG